MYFYDVRRHLSLLLSRFSWGQPGEEFLRSLVFFFLENLYFSLFLKDSFAGYNKLGWIFAVAAATGLCVSDPTLLP